MSKISGYVWINPATGCPSWSTFTQNCDMCGVLNWKSVTVTCGPTTTTTSTTTTSTTSSSTTTTTTTAVPITTTTTTTSTSTSTTSTTSTSTTSTTTTSTSSTTTTTTTNRGNPFRIDVVNTDSVLLAILGNIQYSDGTLFHYYWNSLKNALPGTTSTVYSGYLGASTAAVSLSNTLTFTYHVTVEYSSNAGATWTTLGSYNLAASATHSSTESTPASGLLCILRITIHR